MRAGFSGYALGLMLILETFSAGAQDWQNITMEDIQKKAINTYNEWFGGDAPPLSHEEADSMVCLIAAGSMGTLITVVGGTAIVIGGTVSSATGTAIALPVLISSMWSACSLSKALLPGALWLERRSKMLVSKISGSVMTPVPVNTAPPEDALAIFPP